MYIFVTIGVQGSVIPIMNRVCILVREDLGETAVKVAKLLRKRVADSPEFYGFERGTKVNPSELYYEIYTGSDVDEAPVPFAMSFNSRYRQEYVDGRIIKR